MPELPQMEANGPRVSQPAHWRLIRGGRAGKPADRLVLYRKRSIAGLQHPEEDIGIVRSERLETTQCNESSVMLRCEVSVPSRTSSHPLPLREISIRQQQQVCTLVSGPRSARQIAVIEPP